MGILIGIVVLIVLVVLFSVQNASPVAVTFLFWRFDASLAIVIFLALLSGIIIGAAISLWARRGSRRKPPASPAAPGHADAPETKAF